MPCAPPPPGALCVYFIEGNIASGKTTLLAELERRGHAVVREPVGVWQRVRDSGGSLLQRFYADSGPGIAHMFQSFALLSHAAALRAAVEAACARGERRLFVERSLQSDRLFAEKCRDAGRFSALEWSTYAEAFDMVAALLNLPGTSGTPGADDPEQDEDEPRMPRTPRIVSRRIYLRCAPETAHARLRARGRHEEQEVPISYLADMHVRHEAFFLHGAGGVQVLGTDDQASTSALADAIAGPARSRR